MWMATLDDSGLFADMKTAHIRRMISIRPNEPTWADFESNARAVIVAEAWLDWERYWFYSQMVLRHIRYDRLMKLKTGF